MRANSKIIDKWLLITFILLYCAVGFVSTYHAISLFELANATWLAVILSISFEIGQATVLFSLLSSKKNRDKFIPWLMLFILTGVQIMGNVYASHKWMSNHTATDIQYFKDSVMFFANGLDPEDYKVILVWIVGALLPIIALGLTSIVSRNFQSLEDRDKESQDPRPQNPNDHTKDEYHYDYDTIPRDTTRRPYPKDQKGDINDDTHPMGTTDAIITPEDYLAGVNEAYSGLFGDIDGADQTHTFDDDPFDDDPFDDTTYNTQHTNPISDQELRRREKKREKRKLYRERKRERDKLVNHTYAPPSTDEEYEVDDDAEQDMDIEADYYAGISKPPISPTQPIAHSHDTASDMGYDIGHVVNNNPPVYTNRSTGFFG